MTNLPNKILIVDDDPTVAQGLEEPLSRNGVRIVKADTLESALYYFNQQRFEIALIEQDFQYMPGLAMIQKWRQHEIKVKRYTGFILMVGAQHSAEDEGLLRELGDIEAIVKPFGILQLLPYLSRSLDRRRKAEGMANMVKRIEIAQGSGLSPDQIVEKLKTQLPQLGISGINLICEVLERGTQYQAALDLVDMMLSKMPQNVTLLGRKGRILLRLGRSQEAKDLLILADKAAPKNIQRLEALAEAYLKSEKGSEGANTYRELISLHADEPDKRFEFFDQLSNYGFDTDAMKLCTETTAPQEVVRFYNNKGVAHAKSGELEIAIAEYERAVRYYPNHRDMHKIQFNLAVAHFNRKTRDSLKLAELHARRCLELEPEFEKAQALLEKIDRALNTGSKAT